MASVEADYPLRWRGKTRLRARVISHHHALVGGLRDNDDWRVEQQTTDQRQQADPSSKEADRHGGPPRVWCCRALVGSEPSSLSIGGARCGATGGHSGLSVSTCSDRDRLTAAGQRRRCTGLSPTRHTYSVVRPV